jgi:hypothetical protein
MEYTKLLSDFGLGAVILVILFTIIIPALEKIKERLADLGTSITLLITSLPEIKRRAKEEAETLRERFHDKK